MESVSVVRPDSLAKVNEQTSHASFIRDFLDELSKALQSDCAIGGMQNKIRDRVMRIMNDGKDKDDHAGRSALDARFALGHDTDQYINMAVAPLWVGFGADKHQIVETPPEVRAASAVGIIKAFDEMIADRQDAATKELREAIFVVTWLMECGEIAAVLRDFPGMEGVDGVALLEDVRKADYTNIETLLNTLYTLLDTSSETSPMKMSRQIELENVKRVTERGHDDMERLLSAFLIMGPDVKKWCKANRFSREPEPIGKPFKNLPGFDFKGEDVFDNPILLRRELGESPLSFYQSIVQLRAVDDKKETGVPNIIEALRAKVTDWLSSITEEDVQLYKEYLKKIGLVDQGLVRWALGYIKLDDEDKKRFTHKRIAKGQAAQIIQQLLI